MAYSIFDEPENTSSKSSGIDYFSFKEETVPERTESFYDDTSFSFLRNDPKKISKDEWNNDEERQLKAQRVMQYRDKNLDSEILSLNLFGEDPDNPSNYEETNFHKRDIERLENVFRAEDWTLTSGFENASWLKNAPQEIKDDFESLRTEWNELVENKNLSESAASVWENTKYALGDPLNFLGFGFAKLGLQGTAKLASKMESKRMKDTLLSLATSNTKTANYLRAAAAGFGWNSLADRSSQSVDLALNIKDEYDNLQTLGMGAIGATLGPAFLAGGQLAIKGGRNLADYMLSNGATKSEINRINAINLENELEVDRQIQKETGVVQNIPEEGMTAAQVEDLPMMEKNRAEEINVFADSLKYPYYTKDQEGMFVKDERAAKRDLKRRKDASRAKIEADKEEVRFGGVMPQSQVQEILDAKEYDKFLEDMFEYENTRDIPNVNVEHDYYLIKDVGEIFYNDNKARQNREYLLQSMRHYMYNRKNYPKFANKTANEIDESVQRFEKVAAKVEELDTVKASPEIAVRAKEISNANGGGEQTQQEIEDIMISAQKGNISPDKARSKFYKSLQRLHGKKLFGRPTKFLTKFQESPAALELAERIRYDANLGFIGPAKQVGDDYNETWNAYAGKYSRQLIEALDEIKYIGGGSTKDAMYNQVKQNLKRSIGLPSEKQVELVQGMRSGDIANLDERSQKAATKIRSILNNILKDHEELGLMTDKGRENYLPRLWNKDAIAKDFYGRSTPWTEDGRDAYMGKGENKFAQLLVEDGEAADLNEAKTIIFEMLSKDEATNVNKGAIGNSFFANRKFEKIQDDSKYGEFLDNNIENTMFAYITQASNSYTKKKVLGVSSKDEFEKIWVDKIEQEVKLAKSLRNPDSPDKGQGSFTAQDRKDILDLYSSITGEEMQDWQAPVIRTARDAYTTGTRTATLPFATISSLPEVLLNIRNVGTAETLQNLQEVGKMWAEKSGNERRRIAGEQGLTDPEIFAEMQEFNMIIDNAAISSADRLADRAVNNKPFRVVNNYFFKGILLEQWTHFGQAASFLTGKKLIQNNLKEIADFGDGKPTQRIQNLRNQLAALNVKVDEGVAYINRNKGEVNSKDPFYNDIKSGAARYTRTVIMDNNPRSALKPMFMSNPKSAWLFELMGYPTAFTNKVLFDMARGVANYKDDPEHAARVVATTLIMTASGMGLNEVRNMITDKDTRDEDGLEKMYKGFARNGFIPVLGESSIRAIDQFDRNRPPITIAGEFGGPAVSDAGKIIGGFYSGTPISVIGPRFTPGYYAYSKRTRQDIDNFYQDLFKQSKNTQLYKTGGLVLDVPNVAEEPDERIDKTTGLPYDMQAKGAFIDAEDRPQRARFSVGSQVGSKIVSPFIEFLSNTIMKALARNDRKVDPDSVKNIAHDIQNHYGMKEGEYSDVPSQLDDPDFQRYLGKNVEVLIDEKGGLSKFSPLFGGGGESFSKARGYTPEQIKIFKEAGELDDEMSIAYGDGQDDIAYLSYKLDTIGARTQKIPWERKLEDYIDEANNQDAAFQPLISTGKGVNKKEMLDEIVKDPKIFKTVEKVFSAMPRSLSFSKVVDNYKLPKKDREENKKKFLKDSKEKKLVYRATSDGLNFDFDVAFGFPFETGAHFGTKAQAERMAAEGFSRTSILKQEKDEGVKRIDANLVKNISEEAQREAVADPRLARDDVTAPVSITRGYIKVTNPLVINGTGFAGGSQAQFIIDSPPVRRDITTALMEDGNLEGGLAFREFLKRSQKKMDEIYDWEDEQLDKMVGDGYSKKLSPYQLLIKDILRAEINLDFRNVLQEAGYDSIKYLNIIDSVKGKDLKDQYSYVLFEPGQFKMEAAREFDTSNPRPTFFEGGKVLNTLTKKRVA